MISQEKKDILNKYAQYKSEIKTLEETAEELKVQVLEIMQESGVEEIELPTGKLTLASRRSWKYGPEVISKEKELKELKAKEEQLGIADYTENFYPVYKEAKEE